MPLSSRLSAVGSMTSYVNPWSHRSCVSMPATAARVEGIPINLLAGGCQMRRKERCPPSISSACPVVHSDSGRQKKTTAVAMSSARPARPNGISRPSRLRVAERRLVLAARAIGNGAWRHAIHGDAMRAQLVGHVPRHRLHASLGDVVDHLVGMTGEHANRTDVDDAAANALGDHVPGGVLGEDERRAKIGGDLFVPLGIGDLPERLRNAHSRHC